MSYINMMADSEESYEIPNEIEATLLNLDAGDESLKQNAQTAYVQQYAPDRMGNGGALMTLNAIAAHDEEVQKKRSDLFEFTSENFEFLQHKREMFDRRILFFELRMEAREAEKYMSFMERDGMKDKLRDHMCKNGARREHAEKSVKAYEEFSKLKRQEISGQLDATGTERLQELEKSELVKFAQRHIVKLGKYFGLEDDREELKQLAKAKEDKISAASSGITVPLSMTQTFTDVTQIGKDGAANVQSPKTEQKAEKRADLEVPAPIMG